jgi:heme A synthase
MRTTALRWLALGSTILTTLLIAVGGVVRATESGLGCPGWPKCFGRWIPPFEYHAVIEYSHRLIALIVGVVIAALAVVATRFFRRNRRVFVPAVAALVLVLIQGALGRIVVKGELESLLVTAHFSTAMVLLGTLTYATVSALFWCQTKLVVYERSFLEGRFAILIRRPARLIAQADGDLVAPFARLHQCPGNPVQPRVDLEIFRVDDDLYRFRPDVQLAAEATAGGERRKVMSACWR